MKRIAAVILLVGVAVLMIAPSAFAKSNTVAVPKTVNTITRGQCGGQAFSVDALLGRWSNMGVIDDAASLFGVRSIDDSVGAFAHRNWAIATVAKTSRLKNRGCSGGAFFGPKGVDDRILYPGDKVFVDKRPLKAKYGEGNFSFSPVAGWKKKLVCLEAVANPTCSNPVRGKVCVWVWVRPTKHAAPKPKPKPAPKPSPTPKPKPTVNCPSGSVKDSAGNCVAVVVSCPAGFVKDANGNCVTQTNTAAQACAAKGGNWDTTTQLCTIIQVNGNCSTIIVVNGTGNTVNTTTTGNCNISTPVCPAGTVGTPPNCTVPVCPAGTVGTPPNCTVPVCPAGTVGTPPNCTVPVCPAGTVGTPPNCTPPPPATCVTITSYVDKNDVPVGKTSGQMPFVVNACGAGSVTIDPGNGGISTCDSSVKQTTPLTLPLVAGNNSLCVIYYAPGEASAMSGSVTYTAIQGNAKDVKIDNFAITHPIQT
jgi:hypothetical protein